MYALFLHFFCTLSGDIKMYLKATGLVLPSPRTRDSVMSMLSERIMGTTCLNKEEGDGMLMICKDTHMYTILFQIWCPKSGNVQIYITIQQC